MRDDLEKEDDEASGSGFGDDDEDSTSSRSSLSSSSSSGGNLNVLRGGSDNLPGSGDHDDNDLYTDTNLPTVDPSTTDDEDSQFCLHGFISILSYPAIFTFFLTKHSTNRCASERAAPSL